MLYFTYIYFGLDLCLYLLGVLIFSDRIPHLGNKTDLFFFQISSEVWKAAFFWGRNHIFLCSVRQQPIVLSRVLKPRGRGKHRSFLHYHKKYFFFKSISWSKSRLLPKSRRLPARSISPYFLQVSFRKEILDGEAVFGWDCCIQARLSDPARAAVFRRWKEETFCQCRSGTYHLSFFTSKREFHKPNSGTPLK